MGGSHVATQSRARHFHATAKALTNAAASRGDLDGVLLRADVEDIDVHAIIAGAAADPALVQDTPPETSTISAMTDSLLWLPESEIRREDLLNLHEELRWAESKLMQASERLAEAQEMRRKDLVALAVMRRELLGSFAAERAWILGGRSYFSDVLPALLDREKTLASLVDSGVRTLQVIEELALVRSERKLFELAIVQSDAQLARIDDNEISSEYQVASESYEREPDGASMRELARLRSLSTKNRHEAVRLGHAASELLDELGIAPGMGEVTAANAFLAAEYEGDERSAQRMDDVRAAQFKLELTQLPVPETALKTAIKHPVHFMRARRQTR